MKKNVPYVKVYENGILQNPITESYKNLFPNRLMRRLKPSSKPISSRIGSGIKYWEKQRNRFFLGKVIAK